MMIQICLEKFKRENNGKRHFPLICGQPHSYGNLEQQRILGVSCKGFLRGYAKGSESPKLIRDQSRFQMHKIKTTRYLCTNNLYSSINLWAFHVIVLLNIEEQLQTI